MCSFSMKIKLPMRRDLTKNLLPCLHQRQDLEAASRTSACRTCFRMKRFE